MTTLPENMSDAIDELETAIAEMESRLESVRAERDEAKGRQVELEIENANLRKRLGLAQEQQQATAGILHAISDSFADAKPVFDEILQNIGHLFGSEESLIFLAGEDGQLNIAAARGPNAEAARARFPIPLQGSVSEVVIREKRLVRSADVQNDPDVPAGLRETARSIDQQYSMAVAPLLWKGNAIGTVFVGRTSMVPFSDEECSLLSSFADQAVIAIENARLFNETREALERQTATADVLKVIARSPSNVQPVFEAIASSAKTLLGAFSTTVLRFIEDELHLVAYTPTDPNADEALKSSFPRPLAEFPTFALVRNGETIQFPDTEAEEVPPENRELARLRGFRSVLFTPLMNRGTPVGIISVTRREPGAFAPHHVQLLQTFADQAVIAIENTRLFNETQEALEQQRASSDILRVISSSLADAQPVFAKILDSCKHLFGSDETAVLLVDGEDTIKLGAYVGRQHDAVAASFPAPLDKSPAGRAIREQRVAHYTDVANDPQLTRTVRRVAQLAGYESMAYAPMVSNGRGIGAIGASRHKGGFSDKELTLLQTFADQAVIAIENARLFNETQEALERQTATADILKVIASSPSNLQPVFEAIATRSVQLVGGHSAAVSMFVGDRVDLGAFTPVSPEADAALKALYPRRLADYPLFDLVRGGEVSQVFDMESEARIPLPAKDAARMRGYRSLVLVPMNSDEGPIGAITVTRKEPGTFEPQHVQLLQTFADQAVIAIKNTRLFEEVQARTRDLSESLLQQTAVGDVLKTISRSTFELQPVLDTLVNSAAHLCDADMAFIMRRVGGEYRAGAAVGYTEAYIDFLSNNPLGVNRGTVTGRAVLERRPVQILDVVADPEYTLRETPAVAGQRTTVGVPLLREGEPIGVIVLARRRVEAFTQKQIDLVATFADQAVIAIENVRLFNETREALERQTATSEILRVIAASPSDTTPVFEAIAASANRLLGGFSTAVFRFVDGVAHLTAFTPTNPAADAVLKAAFPRPVDYFEPFQLAKRGEPIPIVDVEQITHAEIKEIARLRGFRSMLFVPLMSAGAPIGIISVTRIETGSFADHHTQLLQTFADQAVIAIENTRLFNETKEALERQTATADILKVIASSPSDAQPVFDAIAESANRLIGGFSAAVFRYRDDRVHLAAFTPTDAEGDAVLQSSFPVPFEQFPPYQLTRHGAPAELPDTELEPAARDIARARGYRSMLFAPLMNDGEPVGIITVTRVSPGPFGEQHTRLLQMFADQAVIAIKNVRLFNEVKARTEDLSEALQQQTATADVLKVISRSAFDLEIVLDTLTASAASLCDADVAAITRPHPEGGYHHATRYNFSAEWERLNETVRLYPGRGSLIGRVLLEGKAVQISDVLADPEYAFPEQQRVGGYRTLLGVPLLREGQPTGVLFLGRTTVEPFTDRQIELVQTYADQAVIAIENVRLFDEVQAKTRDLEEALQQQTATADVLKVISRSAFDLEAVLDALLSSACRLCEADIGTIRYREDGEFRLAATFGCKPEWIEHFQRYSTKPDRSSVFGRTIVEGHIVHIPDLLADPDYDRPEAQRLMGFRAALGVPLVREGEPFGVINLFRFNVSSFEDRQIELVQTFADQAVIAIENVRLFDEVQAKTRDLEEALQQQTATADVLKVISRSAFDLQTVLDALLSSACRLCEADIATIRYRDGGDFRLAATFGAKPEWVEQFAKHSPKAGRESIYGRTIVDGHTVHIPDVLADPELQRSEAQKLMGFRAALGVPLTREGQAFGVITLFRFAVGPFDERQIELVETFADQAVIAIENVRLFDEVQARTRELSEALTYQTGSANILKVIASSPTDVAPVLKAIVESACELCDAYDSVALLKEGDDLRFSAHHGPIPLNVERWPINRKWVSGRAFIDRKPVHVTDLMAEGDEFPDGRELSVRMGHRTMVAVPLLREGESIGALILRRNEVNPFSDKQIALLQTFADQAVIAIGNVRLFEEVQAKSRDLSEALTYQTGSANILKVIASSPTDINPVFQAIVESACELLNAYDAVLRLKNGDNLSFGAHYGPLSTFINERPINRNWTAGRVVLDQKPIQINDLLSPEGDEFPEAQDLARQQGHRTILGVPLLREGESLGTITLRRKEVHPFSDKQIALLQTFADQAVIAIGNVRLFEEVQAKTRDLSEALTYQTGSANILRVIASSPTDVEPVLQSIVESACELCEANDAVVFLQDGDELQMAAHHGPLPEGPVRLPISRTLITGRAFLDREPVHVRDFHSAEGAEFPGGQEIAIRLGHRTVLAVPLLREGESIGMIVLRRNEVHPFTEKQIALLQTFADQAVIAIGNVRLFEQVQAKTRDLTEALEYQTATGDVLNVISRSPNNLQPVMDTIVETAQRLCSSEYALMLQRCDDGTYRVVAHANASDELVRWVHENPVSPGDGSAVGIVAVEQKTLHLHDALADPRFTDLRRQKISKARTMLGVPLMQGDQIIGVIFLARNEVKPFTDKQVELVTSFADQAVIAISNVELFEEVQARTRELTESLEQQTATSEVLRVISSSAGDLVPVFDTMLRKAMELCGANFGVLNTYDGSRFHTGATWGLPPAYDEFRRNQPLQYGPGTAPARLLEGELFVEMTDLPESDAYRQGEANRRALVDLGGARCLLAVPLLKDARVVGNVMIFRQENRRFSEKQIALLQQFAAQAVIAIENTRLLSELRQRTEDLSESLQQQTATADVLKVIASSPTEVAPALQAIVESVCKLCDAYDANVLLKIGNDLHFSAHHGPIPTGRHARPINRDSATGRSVVDKVPVQVSDFQAPEAAEFPEGQRQSREQGHRCTLSVPLLREGEALGAIALRRLEPVAFSDKQIALLQTFADQAVIAIGNVRLFEEVQAKTRDLEESLQHQTATSEVLQAIGSSMADAQPVFERILDITEKLFGSEGLAIFLSPGDGLLHLAARRGRGIEAIDAAFPRPLEQTTAPSVLGEHRQMYFADILNGADVPKSLLQAAQIVGNSSILITPMLWEGRGVGMISVTREPNASFSDKELGLLRTFADQAVIAIENARLFNEVQQRTRELSKSLDDLRTAQDRLVQTEKLASLGQLTAGIAHEIKNPLNFVNNFAALSAELTEELNDVLKPAEIADQVRAEVDELTGLLKANLEKVVQHGRRADSIVKNMLLHSREGGGEHRPSDINALVDESLNLAYHGARAEKPGFNVTLERDFDTAAGQIDLFPQEITRVILNLVSNGFHAVTKRARESGEPGFEPTLRASTKTLGDSVEIRIRDNGTGIPPEVKEKMFNPFFTTKPAGEGTGLGLSMSHDIIVKQHGGTIDVDTEQGHFTEFRIVLPRAGNFSDKSKG